MRILYDDYIDIIIVDALPKLLKIKATFHNQISKTNHQSSEERETISPNIKNIAEIHS